MIFPVYKSQRVAIRHDDFRRANNIVQAPTHDPPRMGEQMSHKNKITRMRDIIVDYFTGTPMGHAQNRLFTLLNTVAADDPKALLGLINKLVPTMFDEPEKQKATGFAPIIIGNVEVTKTEAPKEPKQEMIEVDFLQDAHPTGESPPLTLQGIMQKE